MVKVKYCWIDGFLTMILLYIIILLLMYLIKLNIDLIQPIIWNIIFIVLLMIGVLLDNRFTLWRKFFFVILCVVQIILYYYLDIVPILILKDLFWYSVVLNVSFTWHVLILNWGFFLATKYNNKLVKFIISRVSILTSLTIIKWLIRFIYYFFDNILVYLHMCSVTGHKSEFVSHVIKLLNVFHVIKLFLALILAIIHYFQVVFENYSKLILGKYEFKGFFKQPLSVYIFIIITFIVSISLWIPRIYIIWFIMSIIWVWTKYTDYVNNTRALSDKGINLLQELCILESFYFTWDYSIYVHGFTWDYAMFLHEWSYSGGLYYNIYDFFFVFVYNEYYEIKLYLYYFYIIYSESSLDVESANVFFEKHKISEHFTITPTFFCEHVDAHVVDEFIALPTEVSCSSIRSCVSFVLYFRNLFL